MINFKKINRPLVWGSTYVCLIPLFGLLYWINSSSFMIGNSSDTSESFQVLASFQQELAELLDEVVPSECGECAGITYRTRITTVGEWTIEGEVIVNLVGDPRHLPQNGSFLADYVSVENQEGGDVDILNVLFSFSPPRNELDLLASNYARSLGPENPLFGLAATIIDGSDGVFEQSSVPVVPYIYLSVVTVTTLGFGDISPIDNVGRFLVGVEAILGIVVIGLFLNSLSSVREPTVDQDAEKKPPHVDRVDGAGKSNGPKNGPAKR